MNWLPKWRPCPFVGTYMGTSPSDKLFLVGSRISPISSPYGMGPLGTTVGMWRYGIQNEENLGMLSHKSLKFGIWLEHIIRVSVIMQLIAAATSQALVKYPRDIILRDDALSTKHVMPIWASLTPATRWSCSQQSLLSTGGDCSAT